MITVFIPVYNEEEILEASLGKVHDYLAKRSIDHEIVVVDNGSSDKTVAVGTGFSAKHPWCHFYSIPERGAGRAFTFGAKQARGDVIITLDIDLSSDLVFIDYAIDLIKYSEMVVGSKTMGEQRRSFLRVLGSQAYILCSQLLLNLTLSDYSIGSKAYRRQEIVDALDMIDPWTGYTLDLAVFLKQRGKRIVQIGINCEDNRKSHFNLAHEGWYRYRHLFQVWRRNRPIPR